MYNSDQLMQRHLRNNVGVTNGDATPKNAADTVNQGDVLVKWC